MQGLLIDHLVEHRDGENTFFTLTCTICGTVWQSAAIPGLTRKAAAEDAAKQIHMCPFCGRPVHVIMGGSIHCGTCRALVIIAGTSEDIISTWNKRRK